MEPFLVDMETNEELTLAEVKAEFENLKRNGGTDAETLDDFIRNITSKNGSCVYANEVGKCAWCEEYYPLDELHEEKDLGHLCDNCIQAIGSRGEKLYLEY